MNLDETFLHPEPRKRTTTRTRRRRRNEAFSALLVGAVGENNDKATLGKKKFARIRQPFLSLPRSIIVFLLFSVWILGCVHLAGAVPPGDHSGGGASGINFWSSCLLNKATTALR